MSARHAATLDRRRQEYHEIVKQNFNPDARIDETIMHQIAIDVPRTAPDTPLFRDPNVRESLVRILYCWSIRRPASGYVQGINDIVTPFYNVFFDDASGQSFANNGHDHDDEDDHDCGQDSSRKKTKRLVALEALQQVEADSFWCLSLLLDEIQDNYTFSQVGISRQLARMREVLLRTDPALVAHLDRQGVNLIQFAFRWINCLLIREFPLHMVVRMWDTYLSEGETGFTVYHIYVCAAFLARWSEQIQRMDFQDILLFIQNPPTAGWNLLDLEMLLSEAYVWKTVFEDSLVHLQHSN